MDHILEQLRSFRDERNWQQFHTPKDLAISVCIEAGELLEGFQWKPSGFEPSDEEKAAIADEAADVFLYLLLLCDRLGVDLGEAALNKIAKNAARFPVAASYGLAKPIKDSR